MPFDDGPVPTGPWWRSLLRRALFSAALSGLIGFVVYGIERQNLAHNIVRSLCIGMSCWFFIDGGRLLVARAMSRSGGHGAPLARYGWPGWRWMIVCIVVGVLLAYPLGMMLGHRLTGGEVPSPWSADRGALLGLLLLSLAVAVAITHFFYSRDRLSASQAQAEAAQRLATEHQLRLLESQLEPHMLFNTLANLRALIGIDPPRAQLMLDRLIAYLRATLGASRVSTHSLRAEFARLADFLELMQIRMGDRLESRLDLPEPLAELQVPALLLQPLVENAIKHGLEPKVRGGLIEILARHDGDWLTLSVRDTGTGLGDAASHGTHFGLDQVRQRLLAVYGPQANLTLEAVADLQGGSLASIRIPLAQTRESTA